MFSPVWANNVISFDPIASYSLTFALLMDLLPVLSCARILSIGTGQCSSATWKKSNIQRCYWVGSSCMGKTTLPQPKPAHYPLPYSVTSHSGLTLFSTISSITSPFPILSYHICHSLSLWTTPAKCP